MRPTQEILELCKAACEQLTVPDLHPSQKMMLCGLIAGLDWTMGEDVPAFDLLIAGARIKSRGDADHQAAIDYLDLRMANLRESMFGGEETP